MSRRRPPSKKARPSRGRRAHSARAEFSQLRDGKAPHSLTPTSEPRFPPGRWVIGLHSVREAIRVRPRAVKELWLRQGWESSQELRKFAEDLSLQPRVVGQIHLDRLGSGHQGVALCLGEAPQFDWSRLEVGDRRMVLILDNLQDPHNLGAILRSAWLFGVAVIFIPEMRSAPLTPTALKVASGAAEHVPVVIDQNLQDVIKRLKDLNYWVFGLDAEGPNTIWQQKFPERVVLVVGNEESGIRLPIQRLCDELTRIPQIEGSASLNASVAAAVAMAEVVRQQSQLSGMP